MKHIFSLLLAGIISLSAFAQPAPKREFRGAWIHVKRMMEFHAWLNPYIQFIVI